MATREERAAARMAKELDRLKRGHKVDSAACREFLDLPVEATVEEVLQALHTHLHCFFAQRPGGDVANTLTALEAANQLCKRFVGQ